MGVSDILFGQGGAVPEATSVATGNSVSSTLFGDSAPASSRSNRFRQIAQFLLDQAPMMGGMAGGILAVPPSLAAAPLTGGASLLLGPTAAAAGGGMGGEALRQLGYRGMGLSAPQSPLEALRGINRAGLEQGGAQLAGEGLGRGAMSGARGLMGAALRPTRQLTAGHPNLIDEALQSGATVGRWFGRGGSQAAAAKVKASAAELKPLLSAAEKTGWTLRVASIRPAIRQYVKDAIEGKSAHWQDRETEFMEWFDRFVDQNPGDLAPQAVKDLKRGAQQSAKAVYIKQGLQEVVPVQQLREARFNKVLAGVLKRELETIPGVSGREAITQSLIGPKDAVVRAEQVRPGWWGHGAPYMLAGAAGTIPRGGPVGRAEDVIGTYILARAAQSPAFQSRLAVAMANPAFRMLLKQSPRAALFTLMGQGGAPVEATQTPP